MINAKSYAKKVFAAVDSMDLAQMRLQLTSDCRFRFSNMPEVQGVDAFEEASLQFYAMLSSIKHQLLQSWSTDDGHVISKVTVTYRRRDGFELTCPGATIWRLSDGLISEYQVYVDNSRLFS